jgi:hypothetical protein
MCTGANYSKKGLFCASVSKKYGITLTFAAKLQKGAVGTFFCVPLGTCGWRCWFDLSVSMPWWVMTDARLTRFRVHSCIDSSPTFALRAPRYPRFKHLLGTEGGQLNLIRALHTARCCSLPWVPKELPSCLAVRMLTNNVDQTDYVAWQLYVHLLSSLDHILPAFGASEDFAG